MLKAQPLHARKYLQNEHGCRVEVYAPGGTLFKTFKYNLTDKPEERAICGTGSGGICAFNVAWERPDAFSEGVSHIGSFTNIRGG